MRNVRSSRAVTTHVQNCNIFLHAFYIGNQLLKSHLPLAPLCQVDERIAKGSDPLFFTIKSCIVYVIMTIIIIMIIFKTWLFVKMEFLPMNI